ncbi:hypothetical protein WISP_147494 [Willisornis vidua]|uniref:Uncharacterized protein n=1 Tax=Willisornis vidua TaxID=1566151 RepID=A0ABQ9CKH5_9PASS|nr:hypothetical protein WISP_147494 [Willisornis vidua]
MKRQILLLGYNSPMQHYRLEEDWTESYLEERGMGVLNTNQQCVQVAKKANGILAYISNSVVRDQGSDCPPLPGTAAPFNKKDIEALEHVQKRAMELVKDLEHKSYEEWLRELGLFSLEKRKLRGDLITLYTFMKEGCIQVRVDLFSQLTSDIAKGNNLKLCKRRSRLDISKKLFTERLVRPWDRLPKKMMELPSLKF